MEGSADRHHSAGQDVFSHGAISYPHYMTALSDALIKKRNQYEPAFILLVGDFLRVCEFVEHESRPMFTLIR